VVGEDTHVTSSGGDVDLGHAGRGEERLWGVVSMIARGCDRGRGRGDGEAGGTRAHMLLPVRVHSEGDWELGRPA
jgi:hypothetical protein